MLYSSFYHSNGDSLARLTETKVNYSKEDMVVWEIRQLVFLFLLSFIITKATSTTIIKLVTKLPKQKIDSSLAKKKKKEKKN